ncbi:TraR/DksA C4-type zinc finger protein [Parafrigoribacterium mesophilum]|uniref:TraR/DksA family transcriptional regulator n=1 Tax=Parafrigoribacterium mesophilum TaxID=433646 RepID=UPI0031FDEA64
MNTQHFRDLLIADRAGTQGLMADLGRDVESIVAARRSVSTDDEHDTEGVTLAFERSQTEALIVQSTNRLAQIDAALARLDVGTYGTCEVCGQPIGTARLEARPAARTCINCA